MKSNRKIKNYLMFPRFQFTLVLLNLVIMTVSFGLVFYQVHLSFSELTLIGKGLQLSPENAFFNLINNQRNEIQNKLLMAGAIIYVFSFWLTILVSHQVSGPIYRLKKYFVDLESRGYSGELQFREKDYYHDLAKIVNSALDKNGISKQ